ncbi:MAG: PorT family protein [Saprospiraceae bacterium]|nr:PorT family protein [Saprospiraceae bacterium]
MRTIKTFFNIAVIMLLTLNINAQVTIGVKAGVNVADTEISGFIPSVTPEAHTNTGYTFGIVAEIPIEGSFSFRPELNLVQKGFSIRESMSTEIIGIPIPLGGRVNTRLNYIEMPLLLKYRYGNEKAGLYAIAGPGLGYATSGHIQPFATVIVDIRLPRVELDLSSDTYNRLEFTGHAGIGGELTVGNSGKIFSDVRYSYGFNNVLNDPIVNTKFKNQGLNISVGYAYKF